MTGGSISGSYGFDLVQAPNGDILWANDTVNGNWTYGYDDFNRLVNATQSGQPAYAYAYDRYGNRWQHTYNGSCLSGTSSCIALDANNHVATGGPLSYDAAGNATMDPVHHYYYDAENRIIQVDGAAGNCSTATACYVYDASGQRVRKTTGSSSVDYIYDLGGNVIAEVNSSGGLNRAEVFAGGRHLATYSNSTTYFTHADWLGTERARSSVSGTVCETTTSLPFGDLQSTSGSCGDPSPLHFTGKQRDPESGLDDFGARYDASSFGRFMSPDPKFTGTKLLTNPQDLNLYSYTINNPLRYYDPDGKDWRQAWNDVKTFVGSIEIKFSGGVGYKAAVHAGDFKAEAGMSAKTNSTVLMAGDTVIRNSVSADIGVTAGPTGPGPKFGESVSKEKVTGSIGPGISTGGPEPASTTRTDTLNIFGGSSSTNASSDGRVGLGVEVGDVALLGIDVSASKGGVAALKDFISQVKDEIVPPSPPQPPPPSAPPTTCTPSAACP